MASSEASASKVSFFSVELVVRWWELGIESELGLFGALRVRLKRLGLKGCVVDERNEQRIHIRAFLPVASTPRQDLWQLVLSLEGDARRLGVPQPVVSFQKTDVCETGGRWSPIDVGRHLIIQPANTPDPHSGREVVRLLPRPAFGNGLHPTTRDCLEALERLCRPGLRLADIGCGSGVLAIAAVRLGAGQVLACDVDPVAADAARANIRLNEIDGERITVLEGGVEQLRGTVDGVACNTTAAVLKTVVPRLADLAPAWAVLSGIRDEERDEIAELCAQRGWTPNEWTGQGGWNTAVVAESSPSVRQHSTASSPQHAVGISDTWPLRPTRNFSPHFLR